MAHKREEAKQEAATRLRKRNRAAEEEPNNGSSAKPVAPLCKEGQVGGASLHPLSFQLFVRISFHSGSIPVHASPRDMLHSIRARACAFLNISPATVDSYWLHFSGRALPEDRTLADFGIVKDSILYLLPRMPSLDALESWMLAIDIVDACVEIARISSLPSAGGGILRTQWQGYLENLVLNFLKVEFKSIPQGVSEHMRIFCKSGAAKSLLKLYCSSHTSDIACAARCLDILFTGRKEGLGEVLPCNSAIVFVIPVLLEICSSIGYLLPHHRKHRTLLASSLDKHVGTYLQSSGASEIIYGIAPIVQQISNCIHQNWGIHWAEDSEESSSSHFLNSETNSFISFLIPLCKTLDRNQNKVSTLTVELGSLGWLKTFIFDRHLEDLHDCLRFVFNVKTPSKSLRVLFNVVKALHVMAGVCPDRMPALHSLFQSQASLLNNLIGLLSDRQFKDSDYPWIIEFKSYLQPEVSRKLALSMLPNVKQNSSGPGQRHVYVNRDTLLHETRECLARVEPEVLQRGISVEFKMEKATGPGVLREWFSLICREIFNPFNGLFNSCPKDPRRFFPNPNSVHNPEHLAYFRLCGTVIALALMYNIEIDAVLELSFYKQIAGLPVSWKDIKVADPEMYNSLGKLLEMDAEYVDSDALGLTFVPEVEQLGSLETVELRPSGEEIAVNSRNRLQYIDMMVRSAFVTPIEEMVKAFRDGFSDLLRYGSCNDFFQLLQPEELDSILYGEDRDIDVKHWKTYTHYHGYKESDKEIKWFWKVVSKMSMDQRRRLLHFSTSLSHLPIDGFAVLPSWFHIHKTLPESNHFPIAHTCFYQLILPKYPSFKIMHDRLHFIIQDDVYKGFGLR